jgi:hypothetical protein
MLRHGTVVRCWRKTSARPAIKAKNAKRAKKAVKTIAKPAALAIEGPLGMPVALEVIK